MERTKERNKDLHDLSQKQVVFDVGEMVRYWHLPKSTNGNAAKLKLRNGVYEVTGKHNNRYNIRYPRPIRVSWDAWCRSTEKKPNCPSNS